MIQKILKRSDIKPFKIKYYCERRDPDFESKMHDVLVVYKQVSMQFDEEGNIIIPTDQPMVHTISCDEKPGIQAIATTSGDLRPKRFRTTLQQNQKDATYLYLHQPMVPG